MNENIKQHPLHDDSAASVAATPARKSLKDFFPKITSTDHWKIQDAHITALSQADIMDLRNVAVKAVRATKRCAIRTPLYRQLEEGPVLDDDDDEDDDDEEDASTFEDDGDECLGNLYLPSSVQSAPEPLVHVKKSEEGPVFDDDDDEYDGAEENASTYEDDDDEALDILDLTSAVPPAPEPMVPVKKAGKRRDESRFAAKCAHSGSEVTSGTTGSDNPDADDEKQHTTFLDDVPIMTRDDEKRVQHFMKKYIGSRGKQWKKRKSILPSSK